MRIVSMLLCGLLVALAGCASPVSPRVIDAKYVSNVQGEVKRQIGVYQRVVQEIKDGKLADPADAKDGVYWCGKGKIDFQIASAKIDLATTNDVTNSASAGTSLPLTTVIKIGPNGSQSEEVNNTQEVVYNIWPIPYESQPESLKNALYNEADLANAPIADFLMKLRTGLIDAAKNNSAIVGATPNGPQACVADYNIDTPSADPGNTYKVGLMVTVDDKLGATLNIGLLNFGASAESKDTLANTLTVSFRQSNIPFGIKRCNKDQEKYCEADGTTEVVWDSSTGNGVGVRFAAPEASSAKKTRKKVKGVK